MTQAKSNATPRYHRIPRPAPKWPRSCPTAEFSNVISLVSQYKLRHAVGNRQILGFWPYRILGLAAWNVVLLFDLSSTAAWCARGGKRIGDAGEAALSGGGGPLQKGT